MWGPSVVVLAEQTTGRMLVLLPDEEDRGSSIELLKRTTGLDVLTTSEVPPKEMAGAKFVEAPAVVFDHLGVAVVKPSTNVQSVGAMAQQLGDQAVAVEPERVVYALEDAPITSDGLMAQRVTAPAAALSRDYLRGYRDAAVNLAAAGGVAPAPGAVPAAAVVPAVVDESRVTWGLQATHVPESQFSGKQIKLAVLDTGFDLGHPDFVGRSVISQSFVAGVPIDDVVGHGTHCIGTACGPRNPGVLPRYGIAYAAEIHAGKVLNDQGQGVDGDILAGLEWAITAGCHVVSMSLGATVRPGQTYSRVFERAARRALAAGTLIVAAAGNDSRRDLGVIAPVSHPANCPSIMAVAAIDSQLQTAFFSNGGTPTQGGHIDLGGPGVDVRSSWPTPARYRTISGTSMATPHVAGIAALTADADQANRGAVLWSVLQQHARRLAQPSTDVGSGLVQAP
jgi:subtilisin family serine protease